MRIRNLIFGDIRFQIKYGFYFVYAVFTLFYILLLSIFPASIRANVAAILIYSDPAAMGLFFMGAIVLLEKSQRVLNSIAVSPVKVSEYILSKVISLGIISTIVGVTISLSTNLTNVVEIAVATFLGSVLFSLMGLTIAARISSLNQFMVATIPFELICFVPPIAFLFGYEKSYLMFHPGTIIVSTILGERHFDALTLLILLGWIILLYLITHNIVRKMFLSVGGVKL